MSSPLPIPDMHTDWRGFGQAIVEWLSNRKPDAPVMPALREAQLKGIRPNRYAIVFCTDIANPEPVYFNGTDWIRFSDRTAI